MGEISPENLAFLNKVGQTTAAAPVAAPAPAATTTPKAEDTNVNLS